MSKWNTAFQIIGVAVVLVAWALRQAQLPSAGAAEAAASVSLVLVVALTVASGIEYGYRFVYRYGDFAAKVAARRGGAAD